MTEDLAELDPGKSWQLIQTAMDNPGEEALRDAPASLREFFDQASTPPEWLDYSAFAPGGRMFHRTFFITGRVRDQGISPHFPYQLCRVCRKQ